MNLDRNAGWERWTFKTAAMSKGAARIGEILSGILIGQCRTRVTGTGDGYRGWPGMLAALKAVAS